MPVKPGRVSYSSAEVKRRKTKPQTPGKPGVFSYLIFYLYTMCLMYTVLLYYKYVTISDPKTFRDEQFALCERLGLKGRIIISKEGINGTVEGLKENTDKYVATMQADPRFADVDFKESEGTGSVFPKLSVKVRPEIVTLGTGTAEGEFKKGKYIEPDEFQKWFDEKKDFVVVDMRNDYEHAVGQFENSVLMPVGNFREIPNVVDRFDDLKNKTVVSVCTGGVRCEKATSFLIEKGFTDVHQLHGGMVRYLEKHPGKKFKGSLYVFDGRVAVNYDSPEQHTVIGKCARCGASSEKYINCSNIDCHKHVISCEDCISGGSFCSDDCAEKVAASLAVQVV